MEKKEKNTLAGKTLRMQELEEDKQMFLIKCLEPGDKILQDVFKDRYQSDYIPEILDQLIEKWNKGELKNLNIPEHSFINIAGALLGQYINQELNGQWQLITSEYGTDYICQTVNNKLEFQFYPFSTIKNALQDPTKGKLSGIITAIKEKLK